MVYVSYENGKAIARGLSGKRLSGTVSTNGKTIGDLTFADSVQIIDSNSDGDTKVIYPSRLAGSKLQDKDVKFYALDSTGKISHMILSDATGDLGTYGIITSADEIDQTYGEGWIISGTYKYMIGGKEGVLSGEKIYNVKTGPAVFTYDDDKAIKSMKNLPVVNITSSNDLWVMAGNQKYMLADDVQVYIRDGSKYSATNMSAVSSGYNLKGYYDQSGSAGGRIRIVIATK